MQSQLQRISQYGKKDREETSISTQHASVRDQQQPRWNAEEQESVCQSGAGEVRTGFLAFYYDAIKIRKQLKKKKKKHMPENKERKLNPKLAVGKADQPTIQNYHRFRD